MARRGTFVESDSNESHHSPTVPMVTIETFHWMPGGYFLIHEWEGTVGDQPIRDMEILGRDAVSREYISWVL